MAAHRYWRVNYLNQGTFSGYPNGRGVIGELGFCTTPGGSTVTTGGTGFAANDAGGANTPAAMFDGTDTTFWVSAVSGPYFPMWAGYDFGSGNDQDIVEVYIQASNVTGLGPPPEFWVQSSDDDITYTNEWRCTGIWTTSQLIRFTKPSGTPSFADPHEYWAFEIVNAIPGGATHQLHALADAYFTDSIGGSSLSVGGTASASEDNGGSNPASNAFDGNMSTLWATGDTQHPTTLRYHLTSAAIIVEVALAAGTGYEQSAPTDVNILFSDDGLVWSYGEGWNFTATWPTPEVYQTFDFGAVPGNNTAITTILSGIAQSLSETDTAPDELIHIGTAFGQFSQALNVFKPTSPGTGLRQFWTF